MRLTSRLCSLNAMSTLHAALGDILTCKKKKFYIFIRQEREKVNLYCICDNTRLEIPVSELIVVDRRGNFEPQVGMLVNVLTPDGWAIAEVLEIFVQLNCRLKFHDANFQRKFGSSLHKVHACRAADHIPGSVAAPATLVQPIEQCGIRNGAAIGLNPFVEFFTSNEQGGIQAEDAVEPGLSLSLFQPNEPNSVLDGSEMVKTDRPPTPFPRNKNDGVLYCTAIEELRRFFLAKGRPKPLYGRDERKNKTFMSVVVGDEGYDGYMNKKVGPYTTGEIFELVFPDKSIRSVPALLIQKSKRIYREKTYIELRFLVLYMDGEFLKGWTVNVNINFGQMIILEPCEDEGVLKAYMAFAKYVKEHTPDNVGRDFKRKIIEMPLNGIKLSFNANNCDVFYKRKHMEGSESLISDSTRDEEAVHEDCVAESTKVAKQIEGALDDSLPVASTPSKKAGPKSILKPPRTVSTQKKSVQIVVEPKCTRLENARVDVYDPADVSLLKGYLGESDSPYKRAISAMKHVKLPTKKEVYMCNIGKVYPEILEQFFHSSGEATYSDLVLPVFAHSFKNFGVIPSRIVREARSYRELSESDALDVARFCNGCQIMVFLMEKFCFLVDLHSKRVYVVSSDGQCVLNFDTVPGSLTREMQSAVQKLLRANSCDPTKFIVYSLGLCFPLGRTDDLEHYAVAFALHFMCLMKLSNATGRRLSLDIHKGSSGQYYFMYEKLTLMKNYIYGRSFIRSIKIYALDILLQCAELSLLQGEKTIEELRDMESSDLERLIKEKMERLLGRPGVLCSEPQVLARVYEIFDLSLCIKIVESKDMEDGVLSMLLMLTLYEMCFKTRRYRPAELGELFPDTSDPRESRQDRRAPVNNFPLCGPS